MQDSTARIGGEINSKCGRAVRLLGEVVLSQLPNNGIFHQFQLVEDKITDHDVDLPEYFSFSSFKE